MSRERSGGSGVDVSTEGCHPLSSPAAVIADQDGEETGREALISEHEAAGWRRGGVSGPLPCTSPSAPRPTEEVSPSATLTCFPSAHNSGIRQAMQNYCRTVVYNKAVTALYFRCVTNSLPDIKITRPTPRNTYFIEPRSVLWRVVLTLENLFQYFPADSREFKDIVKILSSSYLESSSMGTFSYAKARLVHSQLLENDFCEKRREMKQEGRTDSELQESYGFLLTDISKVGTCASLQPAQCH
ncbi:hypothetical protein JZ751_005600 [Albula glossodonta]|uniref:Uncharacterized protein n=1 Tax=Albula glossodonta TaxID=121402 RepID=A0A8T2NBJ1_9TELE|nr:hypothetical protein JZ751_005600 [Albula glossodonta]